MDEKTKPTEAVEPSVPSVEYTNARSALFRVIHVDGAIGGLTPNGRCVQFSFYNERAPIPSSTRHAVTVVPEGLQIGAEVAGSRIMRQAIERELEVDVRMDIDTAKVFYVWLRQHLMAAKVDVRALEES